MIQLPVKPSRCEQGHITLLIHLWLMAVIETCYCFYRAVATHEGVIHP
jgi:hypothetical protein